MEVVSKIFRSIVISTLHVIESEDVNNALTQTNIVSKLIKNKDVYALFRAMAETEQKGHESQVNYAYRLLKENRNKNKQLNK
tara:strand:- start:2167 stop:2412 length:246 start_codon:yes stop_codon:yes gene_type:complete